MALDLCCVFVLLLFVVLGYLSGFLAQLLRLIAFVTAYVLSALLAGVVAPLLATHFSLTAVSAKILAGAVLFVSVYACCSMLSWWWLRHRKRGEQSRGFSLDGALGGLFSGIKTALFLLVLFDALTLLAAPFHSQLQPLGLAQSRAAAFARQHSLLSRLTLPVVGDLQTLVELTADRRLQQKVVREPQVQRLLRHPKIRRLVGDRKLQAAARRGDVSALLADPRVDALLQDPELRKLAAGIDLRALSRKHLSPERALAR